MRARVTTPRRSDFAITEVEFGNRLDRDDRPAPDQPSGLAPAHTGRNVTWVAPISNDASSVVKYWRRPEAMVAPVNEERAGIPALSQLLWSCRELSHQREARELLAALAAVP